LFEVWTSEKRHSYENRYTSEECECSPVSVLSNNSFHSCMHHAWQSCHTPSYGDSDAIIGDDWRLGRRWADADGSCMHGSWIMESWIMVSWYHGTTAVLITVNYIYLLQQPFASTWKNHLQDDWVWSAFLNMTRWRSVHQFHLFSLHWLCPRQRCYQVEYTLRGTSGNWSLLDRLKILIRICNVICLKWTATVGSLFTWNRTIPSS
jgi:hypothetical protein